VAEKFSHKSSKTQSFTKNLLQIQPSAIFIIAKFKQSLRVLVFLWQKNEIRIAMVYITSKYQFGITIDIVNY